MLTIGDGGIDWSGLELALEHFGVDDVGDLIHRLCVIKNHRPGSSQGTPDEDAT